jgi:hypothetical protein
MVSASLGWRNDPDALTAFQFQVHGKIMRCGKATKFSGSPANLSAVWVLGWQ